jgi:hypothetical protein
MKITVKGHPEGYLIQNFPANADRVALSERQVTYLLRKIGFNSTEGLELVGGGHEFHIVSEEFGFSRKYTLKRGRRESS